MKNRRVTSSGFITGVLLVGLLLMTAPSAKADVIPVAFCDACGVTGPYGTVTLTQVGSDVVVLIQANPGFSFKTKAEADIFFNPTVTLTANSFKDAAGTVGDLSSGGPSVNGLTFTFNTNKNEAALGTFGVELEAIGKHQLTSTASVGSYDFKVLGVTVKQLEGVNSKGYSWGLHVCDGPEPSCSPTTFFAGGKSPLSVPDGGMTLMLLGGALVGVETLRRRIRA
jgi:hypothetical protein